MRYKVVRTDVINPDIHSKEWEKANVGYVNVDRWQEYNKTPKTSFRLLLGAEGISLLMKSEETNLRAECREENGAVYCDSCMEFFLKPNVHDERYLNFEINPKGILHLGLGVGRQDRTLLCTERNLFSIAAETDNESWRLKLYIPKSFLNEIFGEISPVCKANFYKCGDMTDHVHYGAWSECETEAPDFHVPDFFGIIDLT